MALQIETPSRIWRRIKEAEARDAEMPSLPSLPALDDSGMSDLDPSSFSLEDEAVNVKPNSLASGYAKAQLSAAPPPSGNPRISGKVPTVVSDKAPLHEVVLGEAFEGTNVVPSSSLKKRGTREDKGPTRDIVHKEKHLEVEVCHGGYVGKELPQVSKSVSLSQPSSNAKSSTTVVPPSTLDFDANLPLIDKSQAVHVSGNGGSLSNAIDMCDFKDVAVRKPNGSNRPPVLGRSISSSPPADLGLPSMSDFPSSMWNTDQDRDGSAEHEFETITVQPSVQIGGEEHFRFVTTGGFSEFEGEQNTEKAIESREPTFSSEDAETTRGTGVRFSNVISFPAGLSTPAQTQSNVAKVRTRDYAESNREQTEEDDLATPLPRRKSFLLSVVNSTTRPRLTVPTPHPRAHPQKTVAVATGLTPGPSRLFDTGRRRARLSHPLSQISTFAPSTPLNTLPTGAETDNSPEGATSTSFVSTASSHDLTLHHRVNASFDPLTGPQGVGRFNAGKLNMYLHGLNRRLQEENEILVNKIRSQQGELETLYEQGRHQELSGVMEDDAAEQWMLEKESLERKIVELEMRLGARDKELADEQAQRMRDKERWKERMTEVEDGVGQIVSDLEKRVQEAEMKASLFNDTERQLQALQSELNSARVESEALKQRAKLAEQTVANSKGDGRGLHLHNAAAGELEQDVQTLMHHREEKNDALTSLQKSLSEKEKEISSLQSIIRDLESSLRVTRETIEASQQDAKELRKEQRELRDELRGAQTMIGELKSQSSTAHDRIKHLEEQLSNAQEDLAEKKESLEIANERATVASDELDKARLNIQQLESALEESDRKIVSGNNELLELRSKMAVMEREQERARALNHSQINPLDNRFNIGALEAELAEATKEIGRLTSFLDQNPARKALDKARESRINLLEKENQELLEQLRAHRDPSNFATPLRNATMSGLSPMHRRLINLSLKAPRTPGEPLRNASWLMNTTGEITTTHLMDEIVRLQKELDLANDSIDDKLDKLEEAGLGVVGLTKVLEDARRRIADLESQLEQEVRLPGHICPRCGGSENGRPISRDPNATLQLRLTMVTAELEALRKQRDDEIASSSGEKAVLRDATNRLNVEIRRAKEELRAAQARGHKAEKSKAELQQELTRAKKTIDDLEFYLQAERSRLRSMGVENSNAAKEKERIEEKLYETEQKMEQTKDRLFQLKEANIKLEAELRAERKTASIEEALIGNRETIERLRQERSQLSDKYYDLQQQLAEASKTASDLANKHAKLQMSYDGRRRQLDRQAEEIESLRAALSSQAQTLDSARPNKKVQPDDEDLKSLASKLQSELKRIQQEANRFGRDLVHLKAEREQLVIRHREELDQHEREMKQVRGQLRDLKLQVTSRKENRDFTIDIHAATEALRLRHNRECKGLFVQIRYLKAKFTREATLRDDLGYQKGYLLVLLQRYEKSEKKILAMIARVGPLITPTQQTRLKSLRTAALALIFISRARRASEAWREQRSACSAVAAALDNVRKNRGLKA